MLHFLAAADLHGCPWNLYAALKADPEVCSYAMVNLCPEAPEIRRFLLPD